MLALYAVGRGSIPGRVRTWKIVHAIPLFSIQHFGEEHGSETHSAIRWPVPTVAFTVLAQRCGQKANEREMVVTLLTKNSEGRNFDSDFLKQKQ